MVRNQTVKSIEIIDQDEDEGGVADDDEDNITPLQFNNSSSLPRALAIARNKSEKRKEEGQMHPMQASHHGLKKTPTYVLDKADQIRKANKMNDEEARKRLASNDDKRKEKDHSRSYSIDSIESVNQHLVD